jgi:hypothetical protein
MRFSIRDVLLVTVTVAVLLGWWVDRQQLKARHQERQFRLYEKLVETSEDLRECRTANTKIRTLSLVSEGDDNPTVPDTEPEKMAADRSGATSSALNRRDLD